MKKKQNYAIPIIVMILLFGMISFVTNLASPMGDILKNQFTIPNWQGTLGVFANFIAYAIMGIPAGNMLQKRGYKRTSLVAVSVGFIGVAIQLCSGLVGSFGIYLIGALVAGFSMCLLNTVVNPMLNRLGGGGNKGNQLIQWGGSCNSIGGTLAPILVGWLVGGSIENATVKSASLVMIIAMAIFAIAYVVIKLTNIPEPHMETAEEKAARLAGGKEKDPHSALSFRHFVLGAVAIFFYVGIEVGIPNTANVHFSSLPEVGPAITGTMIGAYWFCMLIGRLIGAPVSSKVSSKTMLAVMSSVAIIFLVCAIFVREDIYISLGETVFPLALGFLVLCGLCTSIMWGAIFNLAVEGLGKYTAAASGIFMTLVCGGGIIPFFQNLLADKVGSMQSYWLIIACLAFLVFYALVGSKNVNKDIKVD